MGRDTTGKMANLSCQYIGVESLGDSAIGEFNLSVIF